MRGPRSKDSIEVKCRQCTWTWTWYGCKLLDMNSTLSVGETGQDSKDQDVKTKVDNSPEQRISLEEGEEVKERGMVCQQNRWGDPLARRRRPQGVVVSVTSQEKKVENRRRWHWR